MEKHEIAYLIELDLERALDKEALYRERVQERSAAAPPWDRSNPPGMPRPMFDNKPVPWSSDSKSPFEPAFEVIDSWRQEQAYKDNLCVLCGEALTDPVYAYVKSDGTVVDGGLHQKCAAITHAHCPHIKAELANHSDELVTVPIRDWTAGIQKANYSGYPLSLEHIGPHQIISATSEDTEPEGENVGFLRDPKSELYPPAFRGDERIPQEVENKLKAHVLNALEAEFHDPDNFIYFTIYGSGISYNWDEAGDFDIQMWVDLDRFQSLHGDHADMTQDDLLAAIRRIIGPINFPTFKEIGLDPPQNKEEDCDGSMMIQYYPKPGKGTKEENLASKPYACYDLETHEWLQKPERMAPTFYGEQFLLLIPKAEDIAVQAEALISELNRHTLDWQFWYALYRRYHNHKYKARFLDAQQKAIQEKEGVQNYFDSVFQGRAKAYSEEGQGIQDERDILQKLLEVWGTFQELKHHARQPLPWEEQELPKLVDENSDEDEKEGDEDAERKEEKEYVHLTLSGWSRSTVPQWERPVNQIRLANFKIVSADVNELANQMWVRLMTQQIQPIIDAQKAGPQEDWNQWNSQQHRNKWIIELFADLLPHAPETYKLWPWIVREWKKRKGTQGDPALNGRGHIRDILQQATEIFGKMRDDPRPEVQLPDVMRDFKGGFNQLEQWIYDYRAQFITSEEPHPEKNKTLYEYPDGFKMVDVASENLGWEGEEMGHCVGGYCNIVTSGGSHILSLRDAKGMPHVTIEVKGAFDRGMAEYVPLFTPQQVKDDLQGGQGSRNIPDAWEVVQIEGKGNRPPNEEYQNRIKTFFETLRSQGVVVKHDEDYSDEVIIRSAEELSDWYHDEKTGPDRNLNPTYDEYGIQYGDIYISGNETSTIDSIIEDLTNERGYRKVSPEEYAKAYTTFMYEMYSNHEGMQRDITKELERVQEKLWDLENDSRDNNWDYIHRGMQDYWKDTHPGEEEPDDWHDTGDPEIDREYEELESHLNEWIAPAFAFVQALGTMWNVWGTGPTEHTPHQQPAPEQPGTNLDVPGAIGKTAAWADVLEKAQRYYSEGRVELQTNMPEHTVATVQGDEGTYETELWRNDPERPDVISLWSCECPWGEHSWGRTRIWKRYEGRPCAHAVVVNWEAQRQGWDTDEQGNEQLQMPMDATEFDQSQQGTTPPPGQSFEQWVAPTPGGPNAPPAPQMPQTQMPVEAPIAQPPPQPPKPNEQLTIPGTFSSWKVAGFQNGDFVRNKLPMDGIDRDNVVHTVPRNTVGEVLWSDDESTIVIFNYESGPLQAHVIRVEAPTKDFAFAPKNILDRGPAPRRRNPNG